MALLNAGGDFSTLNKFHGACFRLARRPVELTCGMAGMSPLNYAVAVYDEELAELCVPHCGAKEFAERSPGGGYTALHFAASGNMDRLARLLLQHKADPELTTDELQMPCGVGVQAAGRTPLHIAADMGHLEVTRVLLEHKADVTALDGDRNTPLLLARMGKRQDVVAVLQAARPDEGPETADVHDEAWIQRKKQQDHADARARLERDMREPTGCLLTVHEMPALWSRQECEWLVRELDAVVAMDGWSHKRHAAYDTTDIPCSQVPAVDDWVRESLRTKLFPELGRLYELPLELHTFSFRDLFFVKYEAKEGEQSGLDLHRDGSVLSFNVLLNPASDFEGGGTYFEDQNKTYSLQQGDCLAHSGKVLHAGAPISSGLRLVLVGFVDAKAIL